MALKAIYQVDREAALRGNRAFRRVWYRSVAAFGFLLVLAGFGLALWSAKERVFGFGVMAYGLFLSVLPEILLRWWLWRQKHLFGLTVEIQIGEDALRSSSPLGSNELSWALFRKVLRRDGFWILAVSPYQALLIPESAFDDTQNQALAELFRSKGLLRT